MYALERSRRPFESRLSLGALERGSRASASSWRTPAISRWAGLAGTPTSTAPLPWWPSAGAGVRRVRSLWRPALVFRPLAPTVRGSGAGRGVGDGAPAREKEEGWAGVGGLKDGNSSDSSVAPATRPSPSA